MSFLPCYAIVPNKHDPSAEPIKIFASSLADLGEKLGVGRAVAKHRNGSDTFCFKGITFHLLRPEPGRKPILPPREGYDTLYPPEIEGTAGEVLSGNMLEDGEPVEDYKTREIFTAIDKEGKEVTANTITEMSKLLGFDLRALTSIRSRLRRRLNGREPTELTHHGITIFITKIDATDENAIPVRARMKPERIREKGEPLMRGLVTHGLGQGWR